MPITPEQFQEMLARTQRNALRVSHPVIHTSPAVEEEEDLHYQIIDLCKSKGWGYIHPRMDKKSTITEGACDFVIFANGGKTWLFECKDREGKLSVKQQGWIMQQAKNGHTVHVVRSLQDVLDVMYQPEFPQSPTQEGGIVRP